MKTFAAILLVSFSVASFATNDKPEVGEKAAECADTPGTACHAKRMAKLNQSEERKAVQGQKSPNANSGTSSATKR